MASILQCIPIQGYWILKTRARCVDEYGFFLGLAIPNIMIDFLLLLMPLHPLWKLKLGLSQRITLVVVFALGYLLVRPCIYVDKIDLFSNPVVSILRLVSFVKVGRKPGDFNGRSLFNGRSFIPEMLESWMLIATDKFISPALWSATEVAIAIFSCSIPSLTYLFRRAAGSIKASNSTRLSDNESPTYGRTDLKGNDIRQINNVQRLHDHASHIGNIELQHYRRDCRGTNSSKDSEDHTLSLGPDQIMVTKDFDVEATTGHN